MPDPLPFDEPKLTDAAFSRPRAALSQKITFAMSVLCLIAATVAAGVAFFIIPYGICYLKVYDCPEGFLARGGIIIMYIIVVATGLWVYRRVQRLWAER